MAFYEAVFGCKLDRHQMGPFDVAWFPWDESRHGAAGSLVKAEGFYKPSTDGAKINFSSDNANIELDRIEKAGGKIIQPKTEINPDIGFLALFHDSEGNEIAIHIQN